MAVFCAGVSGRAVGGRAVGGRGVGGGAVGVMGVVGAGVVDDGRVVGWDGNGSVLQLVSASTKVTRTACNRERRLGDVRKRVAGMWCIRPFCGSAQYRAV